MADTQTQWQCSICASSFGRSEHLKRHVASYHDDKRPHGCVWCSSTFKRRDVLRRHEKTCKARWDEIEEPHPKRACHVEDIAPSASSPTNPWPDIPEPDLSLLNEEVNIDMDQFLTEFHSPLDFTALDQLFSPPSSDIILAERLEYLAYFTSARGMPTFLDRETLQQKQRLMVDHDRDGGTTECSVPSLKSEEIITQLESMITRKGDSDSDSNIITLDWNDVTRQKCEQFFSPGNISRFLDLFWSLWYPNCPIVHRPFFNPETSSVSLLCVMVIIGACMSPYTEDGICAREWLDSVEEMVFSNECFKDTAKGSGDEGFKKQRLECIQAAYMVCSSQKREGSLPAQARVRRYRHAMMVMLARDIGLASATHRNLQLGEASTEWWKQFAVEEELIRTLTYVFLFDAALTIFHNSPPRMVISELKMDVAAPEACFQAESATECFTLLKEWEQTIFWRQRLSISSVVRKICQMELSESSIIEFSHMGTLNLFTTVQSLHSLRFHLQNSIFSSALLPVQTGLENWRRIWIERQPEDKDIPDRPDTLWKQIGFVRYAPEFWQLARVIVNKAMCQLDEEEESGHEGRYDHTDMSDMNGLIMEYRRMSLGSL